MELTAGLFEQVLRTLRADATLREQRQHPRVGLRVRAEVHPLISPAPPEPLQVWVRDLSLQGIGLIASVPLPVGLTFELRLKDRDSAALVVRFRVLRCRQQGAVHTVGALLTEVVESNGPSHDPKRQSLASVVGLTQAQRPKK